MRVIFLGVCTNLLLIASNSSGATLTPEFSADYSIVDLGPVPDVPNPFGGLTLLPDDSNTLIIGGNANNSSGVLYSIQVSRDMDGHIDGFVGTSLEYATAPYNDGGVVFGPNDVLFASRWPVNELGQYLPTSLPGAVAADKVIDMAALGVAQSHAAINFVPPGFGGAGQMKLVSWSGGQFYTATFSPDGFGLFDITSVTQETTLPGGPEGFVWVPQGSPGFPNPSMLVSEFSADTVGTYEVDGSGNPILATRRDFITDLDGAEGAFIDPTNGDFLFSTFGSGSDRVILVKGFVPPVPEPSTFVLGAIGLLCVCCYAWRRKRKAA